MRLCETFQLHPVQISVQVQSPQRIFLPSHGVWLHQVPWPQQRQEIQAYAATGRGILEGNATQ